MQLEHMEAIERRLWSAADTLRANSSYASNEYFLPVMGLIFLRHAYSRYLAVKDGIVAGLPSRGGVTRPLSKEDFSRRSAIFLRPQAQFDYLVALSDGDDRARAIIGAMESIEADYESLRGVLPRQEYTEISNDVLGQLLRTLNPEELKRVSGDVFGRIYEYFLTQFADQKAHDGGEFFTPVSLVSLIAHVLEPQRGSVLDPACGSGGMFVQSARFVEQMRQNPVERLTFYGLEKNSTTIRLAKMNLAVHGLEGNIQQAITYYDDPHELLGKADFVMANPPFNVDEIDADKVARDPRLPFGLPGSNKKGRVSNGNYVWISYFYSYLNARGRAGFVMSSQASSAGRDEAKVRQRLVESGAVEAMIAVRSNFFYTRTVPCELWFLNRGKPEVPSSPALLPEGEGGGGGSLNHKGRVLMIDARHIYRKVTRKIYDFSPEQERNLLAIVWLARGEGEKFRALVTDYGRRTLDAGTACFAFRGEEGVERQPLADFSGALAALVQKLAAVNWHEEAAAQWTEFDAAFAQFKADTEAFRRSLTAAEAEFAETCQVDGEADGANPESSTRPPDRSEVTTLFPLQETARELIRACDLLYKLAARLIDVGEKEESIRGSEGWNSRELARLRKAADEARQAAVEQLRLVRYFWRQAHWLTERFPDGHLRDVPGLVKLVDVAEIAANDWSLTPGRYVGVAPLEEDEDFDFEEAMREIHSELADLNDEAVELAAAIQQNFVELGI